MNKILIVFMLLSFLLIADSVKVDLTVTFNDLTLEQASKLEKIIREDFKDYNLTISIPVKKNESFNPFLLNGISTYDDVLKVTQ